MSKNSVKNLETGLRKIMVSAFSAAGMPRVEADAKAMANLDAALEQFHKARVASVKTHQGSDHTPATLRKRSRGVTRINPKAPLRVRLAAELKQRKISGTRITETASINLAMGAVARWAKKLA